MVIHGFVDEVMKHVLDHLNIEIPPYEPLQDPTRCLQVVEWTIYDGWLSAAKKLYGELCLAPKRKKKSLEKATKIAKLKDEFKTEPEIKLETF